MKELKFLREIKSVAFSTVSKGKPYVRIADVMFIEDNKIYFTTARGKAFHNHLIENPYVALTGMDKNYKTIRLSGPVKMVEKNYLDKIFEKNPMMNDLYPNEKRYILDAFCIYKGVGEIFDLSVTPPSRKRFSFGGEEKRELGYFITDKCIACGICKESCPVNVIEEGEIYKIRKENCLECGSCYEVCPHNAINKPVGF